MKRLIVSAMIAGGIGFAGASPAHAETCSRWHEDVSTNIMLQTCVRSTGGSGTYQFRNLNNHDVQIYFTLNFRDGTSFDGGTPIRANSYSGKSACFNCAPRNAGVASWVITRVDRR